MMKLVLFAVLITFAVADQRFKGTKPPFSVAPRKQPVPYRRPLPVAPKRFPVAPRPLPVAPKRLPVAPRPALPVAPVSSRAQQGVGILRSDSSINPDGSYHYAYDTENGISAEQQGQQKQLGSESSNSVQGSYQYNSPEGVPVVVQYIADENGYQPSSDLLPTPPPVPAAILRALEWIAAHPYKEVKQGFKRF